MSPGREHRPGAGAVTVNEAVTTPPLTRTAVARAVRRGSAAGWSGRRCPRRAGPRPRSPAGRAGPSHLRGDLLGVPRGAVDRPGRGVEGCHGDERRRPRRRAAEVPVTTTPASAAAAPARPRRCGGRSRSRPARRRISANGRDGACRTSSRRRAPERASGDRSLSVIGTPRGRRHGGRRDRRQGEPTRASGVVGEQHAEPGAGLVQGGGDRARVILIASATSGLGQVGDVAQRDSGAGPWGRAGRRRPRAPGRARAAVRVPARCRAS